MSMKPQLPIYEEVGKRCECNLYFYHDWYVLTSELVELVAEVHDRHKQIDSSPQSTIVDLFEYMVGFQEILVDLLRYDS